MNALDLLLGTKRSARATLDLPQLQPPQKKPIPFFETNPFEEAEESTSVAMPLFHSLPDLKKAVKLSMAGHPSPFTCTQQVKPDSAFYDKSDQFTRHCLLSYSHRFIGHRGVNINVVDGARSLRLPLDDDAPTPRRTGKQVLEHARMGMEQYLLEGEDRNALDQ
eukprot:gnl/Dysnectes_brevis/5973_a8933_514.p1 GENE.gnl/Dysnectes_brevis/5973_a8933_514~~gnl/Dysnectes_brevis/5973_a8933_514.p1  ORF type:complete len:164 (+),score=50.11 gnl/Dysnectes_brevis/5973_a8933_514:68-559(+)